MTDLSTLGVNTGVNSHPCLFSREPIRVSIQHEVVQREVFTFACSTSIPQFLLTLWSLIGVQSSACCPVLRSCLRRCRILSPKVLQIRLRKRSASGPVADAACSKSAQPVPNHVLWDHRWEYDKTPEVFFDTRPHTRSRVRLN